MHHPSGIPQKIVDKVVARRGRLHAFESLTAETTALVVIDLDDASVQADAACQRMMATVNTLAAAVRNAGGVVAWVLSRMNAMPKHFRAILGEALAVKYFTDGHDGGGGTRLSGGLHAMAGDIHATKAGASAFFPGKSDLKPQLDARGIDTVLIAGTVTNICCESSARDAAELEYKVILVSDALSGHAHGLHEATERPFLPGDVLFLCSDGVHNVLDAEALTDLLTRWPDPQSCAEAVIAAAIDRRTRDNVTALVVRRGDEADRDD